MPTIPSNNKCSQLACKNNKSKYNSFCLEHGGKDVIASKQDRRKTQALYQSNFWASLRRVQLSKKPLCQACFANNVITQATVVDHVFPWTKLNPEAFYKNEFQSLCFDCHAMKTTLEQKNIIKRYLNGYEESLVLTDYPYFLANLRET